MLFRSQLVLSKLDSMLDEGWNKNVHQNRSSEGDLVTAAPRALVTIHLSGGLAVLEDPLTTNCNLTDLIQLTHSLGS